MKKGNNNKILKIFGLTALSLTFVFGSFSALNINNSRSVNNYLLTVSALNVQPLAESGVLPLLPASTEYGINITYQLSLDRVSPLATTFQWRANDFPAFSEANPLTFVEQLFTAEWPYSFSTFQEAKDRLGTTSDTSATLSNAGNPTTLYGYYYKYNLIADSAINAAGGPFFHANRIVSLPEASAYENANQIYEQDPTNVAAVTNLNTAITNLNAAISSLSNVLSYNEAKYIMEEKAYVDPIFAKYKTFVTKGEARRNLIIVDIQAKYQQYFKDKVFALDYILEYNFYSGGVLAQSQTETESLIAAENSWRLAYAYYDDNNNVITNVNTINRRSFIDTNGEYYQGGFPYDKPDGSDLSQYSKLNDLIKECTVRYTALTQYYANINSFETSVNSLKPVMELTVADKQTVNAVYDAVNSFYTKYKNFLYDGTGSRTNKLKDLLTTIERKKNRINDLEKDDKGTNDTFLIIILCILGFVIIGGGAYLYVALRAKDKGSNLLGNIKKSEINGTDIVEEQVLQTKREIEEEKKQKIKATIEFDKE